MTLIDKSYLLFKWNIFTLIKWINGDYQVLGAG